MAIKKDRTLIIVCSVVGSLGLLSAIMGFSAEGTKLTPYTILVYGDDCLYPQNPAIGLGICAAVFLIVAQVIFSAVGGCCGCCKSRSIPSETKRIVAIVCAVVSWIAAVIAFALFIEGASWNANVWRLGVAPFCPYLKDGVFAGAGVLSLAATALSIASFIMLRSQPAAAEAAPAPPSASTSAVGTPSRPGGPQSPSPEVVIGHPLLQPSAKPHNYPVKPQGYEQQQPHQAATESHSHPEAGYARAPQNNLQSPLPAAHVNAPNQQQLPPRPAPAAAPVVMAATACAPLEPLGVAMGQPLPQLATLPQVVHIPNGTMQYIPAAAAPAMDMPGPFPSTAPPPATGNGPAALSTVIRNEVARQGVKLAAHMVTHTLFSNNTTDSISTGGDDEVQATN